MTREPTEQEVEVMARAICRADEQEQLFTYNHVTQEMEPSSLRWEFDAEYQTLDEAVNEKWRHHEKQARAALSAMPSGWRPIKEAPRDSDFLAAMDNGYITRGRFISGKFFACDSSGPGRNGEPTHFMPLPSPPEQKP